MLAANGGVVLQIGERIEVLRDDGLPVRVIFDRVPENLRARPTLSVTVQSERAGRRPVTLTYLTAGPRLVGRLCRLVRRGQRPDGRPGLDHADQQQRHALRQRQHPARRRRRRRGQWRQYGRRAAGRSASRAPRPRTASGSAISTSIRCPSGRRSPTARPSRSASSTSTARRRRAPTNIAMPGSARPSSRKAPTRVLRFSTSREQGLGDALPAGTVRVYQRDARGNPQFVGESAIGHTPMGSQLGLVTGQAFDVKVRADGRAARAGERRALAHDDALHADQRPARSRSPSTCSSRACGATRGSPRRACRASAARPTRRSGTCPCPPMARRASPRPSTRASEARAMRRPRALLPILLAARRGRAGGGADDRHLGPAGPCRGHRLSRARPRAGERARISQWLIGYRPDQRDPAGDAPGRRERDPLRGRRRRHPAAKRDRHRLSRRRSSSAIATPICSRATSLIDRSLGRRVHLRRTSRATGAVREQDAVIRSGADGAVVLQTRRRVRGAALHRPCRDA